MAKRVGINRLICVLCVILFSVALTVFQAVAEESKGLRVYWEDRDITEGVTLFYHEDESIIGRIFLMQVADEEQDQVIRTQCTSFSTDQPEFITYKEDAVFVASGFKPGKAQLSFTAENGETISITLEMADDKAAENTEKLYEDEGGFAVNESGALTEYKGNATSVVIPESVAGIAVNRIAESAFEGNTTMESLHMPDSIKEVELYAFYGCTALRSVEFGKLLEKLNEGAFQNCLSLSSVTFSQECPITEIPAYCFANCQALQKITLPGSVRSVQDYAFSDCIELTGFEAPAGLESVGSHAFWGTSVQPSDLPANAMIDADAFETVTEEVLALRQALSEESISNIEDESGVVFRQDYLQEEVFSEATPSEAGLDNTDYEMEIPGSLTEASGNETDALSLETLQTTDIQDVPEYEKTYKTIFLDQNGNQVPGNGMDLSSVSGISGVAGEYEEIRVMLDEENRVLREDYYADAGERMAAENGAATRVNRYDDDGSLIEIKYYGTDGAPVNIKDGYATLSKVYNEKKQLIRESYQAADWSPACNADGAYAIEYEYDEAGNLIDSVYLDVNNQLIR